MTPIEEIKGTLTKMADQFSMVLPPQIPLDRFVRVAQTAIQINPALLDCNRQSLYAACMKAATDGLLPDGREAALVPFKGIVQYLPMVGGILKKIRNSGVLKSIGAHVVYEGDEFKYWIDDNGEHLNHVPFFGEPRGIVRLVYAIARTTEGGVYIEVMTERQVELVRAVSRAKDAGPWTLWWGEKAKVAVIKRLSKRLPMSTDVDQIFERDNNNNYDMAPPSPDDTPPPKRSRLESLVLPEPTPETVQHGDYIVDSSSGEVLSHEPHVQPEPEQESEPESEKPESHGIRKPKEAQNFEFLQEMGKIKKEIGDEFYYKCLKDFGYGHCNEIKARGQQVHIYTQMKRFCVAKAELDAEAAAGDII